MRQFGRSGVMTSFELPSVAPLTIDDSQVVIRASKQKSIQSRASVARIRTIKDYENPRSRRLRRNSSIVMENEEATEVFILNRSRQIMVDLLSLLRQVISMNDAAPNIQAALKPLVKSVERTFPPFHARAIQYYLHYDEVRKTATSAHVLSSASVKVQLQAFLKGWTSLQELIDQYADTHPPPHGEEITTKFKAVKSSLEVIMQTNINRKFPNIGLNKCVLSIQSLCDSLAESIVELFMQPEFPNFKTDALKVYKADVKGFSKVLEEAFYNEFPQSGVPLCDLARIKLNVTSSMNDIVAGLTAAFTFLPMMQNAKSLKDVYARDTRPMIEMLSQPFTVVKPLDIPRDYYNAVKPLSPEEKTRKAIQEDNVEERLKNMPPERKVELFLHDVLPLFGSDISSEDDPWDVLFALSKQMKGIVDHYNSNESELEKMKNEIATLKRALNDKIVLEKTKCSVDSCRSFRDELEQLKLQNMRDLRCRKELEEVVVQQQEQLEELKKNKEWRALRRYVCDLLRDVSKQDNVEQFADEELIEQIRITHFATIASYEQRLSEVRIRLGNMLNEVEKTDVSELLDLLEKRLTESKEETAVTGDLNGGMVVPNLKLTDDDRFSATELSTSRSSGRAVMSTSISGTNLAKRGKDYDELFQSLNETREAFFQDLRAVSSRLSEIVGGKCESEHASVMDQVVDEPVSTRKELNALINDQFNALQEMFHAFMENDKELRTKVGSYENELREWKTSITDVIGNHDNLLEATISILNNTQNPLHKRLSDLTNELRQRDKDRQTILTRLAALSGKPPDLQIEQTEENSDGYYTLRKSNIIPLIMASICTIQDQNMDLKDRLAKIEKAHTQLTEDVYSIETRLRYVVDEPSDGDISETELIERLQKYLDVITAPCFSEQYVQVSYLNSLFTGVIPEGVTKPQEYLPIICETYREMRAIIEETKSFLGASNGLFATLNDSEFDEKQLSVLQTNVNALHHSLSRLTGAVTSSPVFIVLGRLITLIQTLVVRLASELGGTVKLV